MSRSPGELDEEFAQFVRARQHQLLRAAYLVCGNELKATQVTQAACVFLAVHWSKVKDDVPDTFVRTRLYRDAIGLRHNGTDEVPSLAHLSPKQRAVTVLRHYEQRSERETADILGSSPGSVRSAAHAGDGLDGLLADLAEPVGEQDLVEAARTGARNVRRRRHRLGLGVTVGAALFAAALVVVPRGSTTDRGLPAPAPSSPRPTLTATPPEGDSRTFNLFNVAAEVGPYRPAVDTLPRIDALTRSQLALPEVLSFGPETRLPSLSEVGNNSAPVRAVLLRRTPEGMHPVLVRPTMSKSFMVVDSVTLTPNLDESGTARSRSRSRRSRTTVGV